MTNSNRIEDVAASHIAYSLNKQREDRLNTQREDPNLTNMIIMFNNIKSIKKVRICLT